MISGKTQTIKLFYDGVASERAGWTEKNRYYHKEVLRLFRRLVPDKANVLAVGSGIGDLLSGLLPRHGVGIDISSNMTRIARMRHPKYAFITGDAQQMPLNEPFEYIVMSDIIGDFEDVQQAFEELKKVSNGQTRIIISHYNYLWEPIFTFLQFLKLKMPQPPQNWLTPVDIRNLLDLADFEIIKEDSHVLFPLYIPVLSPLLNTYISKLPVVRSLCLLHSFVIRQKPNISTDAEYSVSVIIPARNEEGTIEDIVRRMPKLGSSTELIFVEGHSEDNTKTEIERVMRKYKNRIHIRCIDQGSGIGKKDAVLKGFTKAHGDILMILDADLSITPEDLVKVYLALRTGKGEFVQGTRLVYPLEKDSMRFVNKIGNKFFSVMFTWILNQHISDTLCGTKALFRKEYEKIHSLLSSKRWNDVDPFGDFDLIFGSTLANLKIIEIPLRYYPRVYGTTNISRFYHGWQCLKMIWFAIRRMKFS